MASSFALKRLVSSSILYRTLSSTITPSATSASRLFNTKAVCEYDDDRDLDIHHRSARSFPHRRDDFFSATRSLSQVLNLMDQMAERPFC